MPTSDGLAFTWQEWANHDAMALAQLVKNNEVTVSELVHQVASAVESVNPAIEAVIEVFDDVMMDPNADVPNPDGLLYGVPLLLKDEGSGLKGRRQEGGTSLLEGFISEVTDPLMDNFLRAGLIPIGRATVPELGMSFNTVTMYRGGLKITRNPWDLERTSGGSSGGSSAAVAAGITPIAGASDGGGSTRIPASFCGLVGLKATRGRVPPPQIRNEYMRRISMEGVLTRSVRDTAATYDYISRVPNGGTFMKLAPPAGSYLTAIERPPGPLKVALSLGTWGRAGAPDAEVADRVREVGSLMEELGHDVEEIVDDGVICDWSSMWLAYETEWITLCAQFKTIASERGIDPTNLPLYLSPMLRRHVEAAESYDKFDLFAMMKANNRVTRQYGDFIERYDVLMTPTLPIRVPEANGPYSTWRDEDLDRWLTRKIDACRYTMPGNEIGMPAISIPAGVDSDGLPIGVQFYGDFGREDQLLQVAAEVERAKSEWFGRTPSVHVSRPDLRSLHSAETDDRDRP